MYVCSAAFHSALIGDLGTIHQRINAYEAVGVQELLIRFLFLDTDPVALIQRFAEADLLISGDAEATMPTLIEALKVQMSAADKNRVAARGKKVKEQSAKLLDQLRQQVAFEWDANPISSGRMVMELWDQIKNEDWMMPTETQFLSDWPYRLWDIDKPYRTLDTLVAPKHAAPL